MITRLASLAVCAAVFVGILVVQAQAQTGPTVSPATSITPESAILHGSIPTYGTEDLYSFEYDTLADWEAGGDNASFTDDVLIPAAAATTLNVSGEAGCYPAATCTDQETLLPNTKYVYFLSVQYNVSGAYYDVGTVTSSEGTFTTTNLGKVELTSKTVEVKKRTASIDLECTSAEPCDGSLTLTTRSKGKTITCSSGTFSVKAGKKSTVKKAVSSKCLKLLAKSTTLTWGGTLNAVTTTDQAGLKHKSVKLALATTSKT